MLYLILKFPWSVVVNWILKRKKLTYVNIGSPWFPRYQRTVASCSLGSSGLILQDKEAFFPTKAKICWTISDDPERIKKVKVKCLQLSMSECKVFCCP